MYLAHGSGRTRIDACADQYSRLQRRSRLARHCRHHHSVGASVWPQSRPRLSRSRRDPGPSRTGIVHWKLPVSLLVYRGRCEERFRLCRPWYRVPAFPHRHGAILRAIEGDAPPDLRARRLANRAFGRGDRRHRSPCRQQASGGAHPRCVPGFVVNRHRRRVAFQTGTTQHQCGSGQFRDAAGAGSGGSPSPAVHLHFRHGRGRFGRRDTPPGAHERRHRTRRDRGCWPRGDEAPVPSRRIRRHERIVRRHDAVRDRRNRGGRRRSRLLDGAGRLCGRPAACRNGIPQGDRDGHRSLQGPFAGPVLFHGRHEYRFPRACPRSGLADWGCSRAHCREIRYPRRPCPAVSSVLAGFA